MLPHTSAAPSGVLPFAMPGRGFQFGYMFGPDDGGIKRGDRTDTGDNEARPDESDSGFAQPTGDPTSFGGSTSIRTPSSGGLDLEGELSGDDGFETMLPDDGRLGLTNLGDTPADDWAADTGPTRSAESE